MDSEVVETPTLEAGADTQYFRLLLSMSESGRGGGKGLLV